MKAYTGMAAVLVAAICSYGQSPGGSGPPMAAHEFEGPMGLGLARGKVVTGQPYSADVTNSVEQTLADGNTIARTTNGRAARDSKGRTYSEETIEGGPWARGGSVTLTFLADPVAGFVYVLNPSRKLAMRRPFPRSGLHGWRQMPGGEAKDRVETSLGQQTINGIAVTGKSITHTIPAGSIGNAQPIVDKSEIWTARDLQVVVKATHSDPRTGQMTYELTNLRRGEPNATLFQVPADYTVHDAPSF